MNKAEVIEWKLKKLNKFEGASVRTEDNVITHWEANGVPQPSDDDLIQWEKDQKADKIVKDKEKKDETKIILDKMGITVKEWEYLQAN